MAKVALSNITNPKPGAWPVEATLDGKRLTFTEDWRSEKLAAALASLLAEKIADSIFSIFPLIGVFSLLLHIVAPIGDFWFDLFLISIALVMVGWTRDLAKYAPVKENSETVDVKKYFTSTSLVLLRRALANRGDRSADPVHLFIQLIANRDVQTVFYRLGIGFREIAKDLLNLLNGLSVPPPAVSADLGAIPYIAYEMMKQTGASRITPPILLLSLSRLPDSTKTAQLFEEFDIKAEHIYFAVRWRGVLDNIRKERADNAALRILKPKGEINRSFTSLPTPVLDRFSSDLTVLARAGSAFMVGREREIDKILSAFTSDRIGVLLVGDDGVGKTSIIRMLAEKMLIEDVPPRLKDKRLVRLDLAAILGESDEAGHALTASINDALRGGDIVLVVEDIHEFAEARASGVSILSILTSAIKNSGLPVIATTTPRSYESVPALNSAEIFERIDIQEMDREHLILIACVYASIQEAKFKNLFWTLEAVMEAVDLSTRYMQAGRQPARAIKVLEVVSERFSGVKTEEGRIVVISPKEVQFVVSELTHVDAQDVGEGEAEKLLHLESKLHERIIGQDDAVSAVAAAMRRMKARLSTTGKRPLASFLFVGPTGVGKTEIAKGLADIEFGSERSIIRLDMSEYNLPESVERLIGGRTFVSSFVSELRERPQSVVLLDEFEKAHPEIQNIFLTILDEGYLTESSGSRVDLTNTIIIATSNAASQEIKRGFGAGLDAKTLLEKLMHDALTRYFKPELLNRFDSVVLFRPLNTEEVAKIVRIQLGKLEARLAEMGIKMKIDEDGVRKIAENGFDPVYGARPLARYLQEKIEGPVASWILAKDIVRRDSVVIGKTGEPEIEKAASLS